jgi:hypothetical protein
LPVLSEPPDLPPDEELPPPDDDLARLEGNAVVTASDVVPPPEDDTEGGDGNGKPRHLRITIRRSGDQEQDKRRVGQVYGLLHQRRGNDQFTFVIVDGRRRVQVDFPNETTRYSYELGQSLRDVLGRDALQVM